MQAYRIFAEVSDDHFSEEMEWKDSVCEKNIWQIKMDKNLFDEKSILWEETGSDKL